MTVVPPWRTRCVRALRALVCAAAALLAACHSSTNLPPGTPVVTMSDLTNSGDFMSYIVNIDAIQLTRIDGTVVTPLVIPQTVNLARLNTMTELVEAPAVPEGTYKSALIVLDYTSTLLVWLNVNGATQSATPENVSGASLTTVAVLVTFDPANPLIVTQGKGVRLQIDVDATASNEVTTPTAPAVVTVQPFVVVTPAPVDTTVMRLRGLFVTTQDVTSGFYMNTRPFYDLSSALGAVIVHTNAQTYFNINGVVYTGAAGLQVLATQTQQQIPLAVYGTLDDLSGITPTFNATEVYFGSAQESALAYYLTGTVTARSDDSLTLGAATYITPLGINLYQDKVTPITIGSGTTVFEDGIATPGLTLADISVGQQVNIAGLPTYDSTGTVITSLNATLGQVRLQPTTLWGLQNADGTVDVLSLGRFGPASLSFAGTGIPGHDATPSAYVLDTSAVPPGPVITTGELLQVQGSVTRFGSAPPDFTARKITPGPSTLQTLVVNWTGAGSAAPFSSNTSAGLVVNLADANLGATHAIRTGPASLDMKSLPASPLITTGTSPYLALAIGSTSLSTGIAVYNSAAAFRTAVSSTFSGSNKITKLVAYGQYDSASNTFVASRISVALHE